MDGSPSVMDESITPAQIAALSVSIFAIIVFTSFSIYLCGRHRGSQDATRRHTLALSRPHHEHRRLSETTQASTVEASNSRHGRFAKLKAALGIKTTKQASSSSPSREKSTSSAARMRAASPLQIHFHPGSAGSNSHAQTAEFQAAVHNLLGYSADEIQEWYPDSDDEHGQHETAAHMEPFSAIDGGSSPLPVYEEVEQRRFSWQGDESDYRPEKR